MGSYLAVLAAVPYFGSRPLVASSAAVLLVAFGVFEPGAPPQSRLLASVVIATLFAVWAAQQFVWGHVEAVWPRDPSALDVIGRTTRAPAADTQAHVFALLARCRCRACAEPLNAGRPEASCALCGARAFPTPDDIRTFLRSADRALMRILPLLALIGAVPVIGLVAGLCVLRLSSASAVAAHGRWKHRLVARVVRTGLLLAFSLLQVIPFVGAAAVPLIAVASHLSNRRPLRRAAASAASAAPANPLPPATV